MSKDKMPDKIWVIKPKNEPSYWFVDKPEYDYSEQGYTKYIKKSEAVSVKDICLHYNKTQGGIT